MNFNEYLEKYNAQKKINKLVKTYKNKKIVVYGAGQFAQIIFEKYDLSKLNIIGIADDKFKGNNNCKFFNLKCIEPKHLGSIDCDVILIANIDYRKYLTILDDHVLYQSKNENVDIRPLINLTFLDLLKR